MHCRCLGLDWDCQLVKKNIMAKKKSKAEGRPRGRPKKRLNPGLAVVFARREAERAAALASDDRTVHPQPRQHPAAAAAPPHAEANGGRPPRSSRGRRSRRRARRDAPPGPPRRSDRRRGGVERFEAGPAVLPFSKARAHKVRIARARRKYEELRGRIREDELRAARRRNAELESENARLEGATKQGSAAELGPRPRPSSSAETAETSGRDEPSSRRPSSVRDGLAAAAAPAASTANAFVAPNAFGSSTGATSFGNPWYRQHYPYYGMMSAPFGCFTSAAQMNTGFPAYLAATTLQLGRPTLGTLVRPPAAMYDMPASATSSNPPPASSGTAGEDDGSAIPPPLAVAVLTEDGGGDDKVDEAAPGCGSGGGGLDGPAPGKSPTAVAVGSADRPNYTRVPGASAIIGLRFDV
ncbi:hypothetical protein THAOC_18275 [Thalassiosira oceanica]|uniref:BZIP domain-containing protein n=1 Tax=Thalassiosira oceanica TaxID=159749 RepID=K0S5D3_THAOC|nr:hypothetical protein THAOC_18275 [Thalassiosira oceanica]|eukprot:EJK61273.1 hypothetical protein THAOC_18275 [Thalassiosira oceanica]